MIQYKFQYQSVPISESAVSKQEQVGHDALLPPGVFWSMESRRVRLTFTDQNWKFSKAFRQEIMVCLQAENLQ